MANKFQALLALLGKNKQAQVQAPVNSQYQGLAQMLPQLQDGLAGQLPPLDINVLAQRNGTVNLGQGGMNPNSTVSLNQGGMNPQTHPLLAGIKQGANKAKHYLLDPVYNTPTGDATIDATDPKKLTDSRLGRFAVNAIAGLAQQYQNPDNPLAGALGAYSAGARMREGDLKEYQARLGKKAMVDEYANWGYKPNPLLDEKQQAEGFKLFIENERNRKGNELLAEPDTTARIRKEMTPPQVVKVDPVTGKKTYTTGLRQTSPYAIIADPKFYAGKQQREQQKQNQEAQQALAKERIEETKQQNRRNFLLATQRINLTKAEQAQQERQFQQTHGLKIKEFDFKVEQARKQKPEETTQLERALADGRISEQQFVNAVMGNPKDRRGNPINVPIQPKKATPKATPKQSTAQEALLPAPKRTAQGGYQTSAGDLPAFNITVRR